MSEYVSTRGAYRDEPRSYSDVVLEGLAPDRGLYVPAEYARFSHQELIALSRQAYPELFVSVRSKFVGESMTIAEQKSLVTQAYTSDKFPRVEDDNYVPVRRVGDNLFIQNLSLGPTAAFKDMALQAVAQDMDRELSRRGRQLTILGATSGDTGSAAEAALRPIDGVELFMLSPEHGTMSDFQRAQMAELSGETVHNLSMDAPFGALQKLVKDIKMDPEFADLGAVNSINWARVASQVPYYFSGYFQAIEQSGSGAKIGDEVDFVVPSGNMGNAAAGYIARKMGLPIRSIIVATNENDVLHRLIQDGDYIKKDTYLTSSPSMDIDSASNYERPVFDLLDNDPEQTARYMEQFEQTGIVNFADIGRDDIDLKAAGFDSGTSDHALRLATIHRLHQENDDIIDPHTADGVGVALARGPRDVPTICLETALPVKFEATVHQAIGIVPAREERFRNIEQALTREMGFVAVQGDLANLQDFIRSHSRYMGQ